MTERLRFKNGDTGNIVQVIMDMDAEADNYVDDEAAQCLRGSDDYETLRNVWKFVKYNIRYKADRRGAEKVKSPAALFRMGVGDCKSFSIAEAALLRSLGFKGIRYRFTSYNNNRDVTHVYVVVKHQGRDVILDAVHSRFDDEVPYAYKKDIKAAKTGISGLPEHSTCPQPGFLTLFAIGLIAWGITR